MSGDVWVARAIGELRQAEADEEQAVRALVQAEEGLTKARHDLERAEEELRDRLFVSACTTAGFWPPHGFVKAPVDQAIEVFLGEAKRELKIADVTGWVARAGDRVLQISRSYHANGLAAGSEVVIDWGPEHGGGGTNA